MKNTKILFLGENPTTSSPTKMLAEQLERFGFESIFAYRLDFESTSKWIKSVLESDIVVLVDYDGPKSFRLRQLAIAACLFRPIVRWWVGSDVLYCIEDPALGRAAKKLDSISHNIVVAPHLQRELLMLNISSMYIPSVIPIDFQEVIEESSTVRDSVLVYLPSKRKEFYGYSNVKRIIERMPRVKFLVVGDVEHSLSSYENVSSLGWVEDMGQIWPSVRCILRLTKHDGMPRIILEGLRRGCYAVYSWEMPGCSLAKSAEQAIPLLEKAFMGPKINERAQSAFSNLMEPLPAELYSRELDRIKSSVRVRALYWVKGLWLVLSHTIQGYISRRD